MPRNLLDLLFRYSHAHGNEVAAVLVFPFIDDLCFDMLNTGFFRQVYLSIGRSSPVAVSSPRCFNILDIS